MSKTVTVQYHPYAAMAKEERKELSTVRRSILSEARTYAVENNEDTNNNVQMPQIITDSYLKKELN